MRVEAFLAMAFLCAACNRNAEPPPAPRQATPVPIPTKAKTRSVLLFFADPDGNGLTARRLDVPAAPDPGTLAGEALTALFQGTSAIASRSPVPINALPAGVELRSFFLDGKGTATVDLGHLPEHLAGGTEAEVLALWSVVDTLGFNFPSDARAVRILLDGHEVDGLGHVALDAPLTPRRDIIVGDLPPPPATP